MEVLGIVHDEKAIPGGPMTIRSTRPEGHPLGGSHIFSFSNSFCKMKRCDLSNCWPFSYWDSVKSDRNHSTLHNPVAQIPNPISHDQSRGGGICNPFRVEGSGGRFTQGSSVLATLG